MFYSYNYCIFSLGKRWGVYTESLLALGPWVKTSHCRLSINLLQFSCYWQKAKTIVLKDIVWRKLIHLELWRYSMYLYNSSRMFFCETS